MEDPFPNAENVFRSAFEGPNPVDFLLNLIKTYPKPKTITELVVVYMDLVHKFPTECDKFARTLAELRDSVEPTIAGYDRLGNPETQMIADALFDALAEFHESDLAGVDDTSVTPGNEYLVASLLCAVSMKYGLCRSPSHVSSIRRGLHYRNKGYGDNAASREVLALGACLQLLVTRCGPMSEEVDCDDVLGLLEEIKRACVVKDANGRRLLEVCGRFGCTFYMT